MPSSVMLTAVTTMDKVIANDLQSCRDNGFPTALDDTSYFDVLLSYDEELRPHLTSWNFIRSLKSEVQAMVSRFVSDRSLMLTEGKVWRYPRILLVLRLLSKLSTGEDGPYVEDVVRKCVRELEESVTTAGELSARFLHSGRLILGLFDMISPNAYMDIGHTPYFKKILGVACLVYGSPSAPPSSFLRFWISSLPVEDITRQAFSALIELLQDEVHFTEDLMKSCWECIVNMFKDCQDYMEACMCVTLETCLVLLKSEPGLSKVAEQFFRLCSPEVALLDWLMEVVSAGGSDSRLAFDFFEKVHASSRVNVARAYALSLGSINSHRVTVAVDMLTRLLALVKENPTILSETPCVQDCWATVLLFDSSIRMRRLCMETLSDFCHIPADLAEAIALKTRDTDAGVREKGWTAFLKLPTSILIEFLVSKELDCAVLTELKQSYKPARQGACSFEAMQEFLRALLATEEIQEPLAWRLSFLPSVTRDVKFLRSVSPV